MRKKIVTLITATLLFAALPFGLNTYSAAGAETNTPLVTTRKGLLDAVYAAVEGGTIYVGDINFSDFSPGAHIIPSLKRVTINKSLTIKSGKPDGSQAVLSGGSFIISGPMQESRNISCVFENVLFDGGIAGDSLAKEDWDCDEGEPEPYQSQYAATFKGNVDASFRDCGFTRYMHDYGGAMFGYYGEYDWTEPGDELYAYRDNKYCNLNISLADCNFTENSAYYAGGAVYLAGLESKNVSLLAGNCTFYRNNTSVGMHENKEGYVGFYGEGGGAIYAGRTNVTLYDCRIDGNIGNRIYGSAHRDGTKGGGLFCDNGTLKMISCQITGNTASRGGGMYLCNNEAEIDGCVIAENSASTQAVLYAEDVTYDEKTGDTTVVITDRIMTGLSSGEGYAGGILIDIDGPVSAQFLNTSVVQNSAQYAYGGFYTAYMKGMEFTNGFGSIDFMLCTYTDNRCDYEYDPETGMLWIERPGDIWEIPFVQAFGCVIADDSFADEYPRIETPGKDNNYNYFAPPKKAAGDGILEDNTPHPAYEIPVDTLKTVFDGRFKNAVGPFYVGRNYNPAVALRLDAAGGMVEQAEATQSYGRAAVLPEPTRKKYTFEGWYDRDGAVYPTDGLLFGVDVSTYDLYAKWTVSADGSNSVPPWSIALIALGAGLFIGIVTLFILRRRKPVPASGSASTDPLVMNEDGLDAIARSYNLTAREKEIAALLIEGKTQKAIADELFIGVETVKTHAKNLYDKLGVKNKYELFAKLKK